MLEPSIANKEDTMSLSEEDLTDELIEYIEYCIDETESIETEKHRKYSLFGDFLFSPKLKRFYC